MPESIQTYAARLLAAARPSQLRGGSDAVRDAVGPAAAVEVREENARFVVDRRVAAYGGRRG